MASWKLDPSFIAQVQGSSHTKVTLSSHTLPTSTTAPQYRSAQSAVTDLQVMGKPMNSIHLDRSHFQGPALWPWTEGPSVKPISWIFGQETEPQGRNPTVQAAYCLREACLSWADTQYCTIFPWFVCVPGCPVDDDDSTDFGASVDGDNLAKVLPQYLNSIPFSARTYR